MLYEKIMASMQLEAICIHSSEIIIHLTYDNDQSQSLLWSENGLNWSVHEEHHK